MHAPLEAIFGHPCGTDSWCVYVPSMGCTKTLRRTSFSMVDPRRRRLEELAQAELAQATRQARQERRPQNQSRQLPPPRSTTRRGARPRPRAVSPLLREGDRPIDTTTATVLRARLHTLRGNAVNMQHEIDELTDLLDDTYLEI